MYIPRTFYERGKRFEGRTEWKDRAAWAAFAPVTKATNQLTDQDLRAHLFDSKVLPALCYADHGRHRCHVRKLLATHRALERCILKFNQHTQHLAGLRGSDLRAMSRLSDPSEYISKANHR
ncbi:hypothetical protein RB195_010189 [Necator americanus]|uniref:Uncharacterized protein n=1 Tax=Necator americanus TaxID=51031 RepID=A0ABR1CY25_NECAM